VLRLIRVRVGSLRLGDLPPGQWRLLSAAEVEKLAGD
jgi:23S rRNA pseudouridine2605 synthase